MNRNTLSQDRKAHHAQFNIRDLFELAVDGLEEMFDPKTQLFCFRLNRTPSGLVREGSSRRYTMMALLGLHQLETAAGIRSRIDVKATFDNLVGTDDQMADLGDLGLLLWLCAVVSPQDLERLYSKIDISNALSHYAAGREGRTMELSWFLSGLAHASLASTQHRDAASVAMKTYELIKRNQGGKGIFGHLARNRSLAGLLRGGIGSFADQVYPIYAFSKFGEAYNVPEALLPAMNCAEAICEAQGRMGQWWWHYNSSTGSTVEQYPVYSVHQHGMAPMALFALAEATGKDFTPAIYKGLGWIAGNNELGSDFRNPTAKIIWRSVYRNGYGRHFRAAMSMLRRAENSPAPTKMTIKFECRPYELGWLLYAFAGRECVVTPAHG